MTDRGSGDSLSVRLALRSYRLALRCYPDAFRREFGSELMSAFAELARSARARGGWPGLVAVWFRALLDVGWHGSSERLRRARSISGAPTRTARARAVRYLRSQPPSVSAPPMETLLQDLRFAARQLRRSPGVTLALVVTIALGVGASATIFTVVDGVLLRPLPFPDSERAVVLCETHERVEGYCVASPPNVADWVRLAGSLESGGVARTFPYSLADEQGAASLTAGIATPGYLEVFGARAALGRLLEERDLPEGDNRVVLLNHGFWRSRFGADPGIVGRTIGLNGEPYTVVGVLEEATWIHDLGWVPAWVPLTATPEQTDNRGWRGFSAVARRAEGSSIERVREELEGLRAGLADEYPEANRDWGLRVTPLRERVAGPVRETLLLFVVAVGCLLAIGCANVAHLLLVRATDRTAEFAVRASLGAGRFRLARQLLTESLLLATIGGALGLALGTVTTRLFLSLAPADIPRLEEVGVDLRVVLFGAGLSLLTAVLFGLAPGLRAARTDLSSTLRSVRHGDAGSRRLRNGLVVGQIAAALVLLVVAGLLGRSFMGLLSWTPGFDPGGVVTVWSFANTNAFSGGDEITAAFDRVEAEIEALPGVQAVGQTSAGPLFGGRETTSMEVLGRPPLAADERPTVRWYDVDDDYFATLGIPLVAGRTFDASDDAGSEPVAVVNRSFVRRHLSDGGAIGSRVRVGERELRIVGVIADVDPFLPGESPMAEIYYPRAQYPRGGTYFVVRSGVPLADLERQVRERVEAGVPGIVISGFQTLQERAGRARLSPRFVLAIAALFAGAALTLAAVGVYGVIAYGVATRSHELGVRMALGARPAGILRSVLGSGLALAAGGLVLGLAAAVAVGRLVASQLHGVSERDPVTYVVVAAVLITVVLAASAVPARRASRLDPVRALRSE